MKLKDLTELSKQEFIKKHPTNPYPFGTKYSDKKANGLTKAIVDFIRFLGGYSDRINNMGVYRAGKTIDRYHEVLVEKGKWTPSGSRKGIADIMGSYKGKMLAIEVKIGKDRMSEHQAIIQNEVNASGGVYIIARTWEQFYNEWIKHFPV